MSPPVLQSYDTRIKMPEDERATHYRLNYRCPILTEKFKCNLILLITHIYCFVGQTRVVLMVDVCNNENAVVVHVGVI